MRTLQAGGSDVLASLNSDEVFDAVVVGAGPAGAAAALVMGRAGLSILLIESSAFPRWKVCGCCLGTTGQAVLEELGCDSVLQDARAVHLQRTQVTWRGRSVRLPGGGMRVVSRAVLDSGLVDAAARSGVMTAFGCRARLEDAGREGGDLARVRLTETADRSSSVCVRARAVVVASGLSGLGGAESRAVRIRRGSLMGLGVVSDVAPPWLERGTLSMVCSPIGYVGCVHDELGQAVWGAAVRPAAFREAGSPALVVQRIMQQARMSMDGLPSESWKGTPLLTRRSTASTGRTYNVGDSLGYVEPVTGEGMSWGLLTGAECGSLIAQAGSDEAQGIEPGVGRAWKKRSSGLMRLRRVRCAAVSRAVRNRLAMGVLTALPTGIVEAWPSLFDMAIGAHPTGGRRRWVV